jgi:hypothetical protein
MQLKAGKWYTSQVSENCPFPLPQRNWTWEGWCSLHPAQQWLFGILYLPATHLPALRFYFIIITILVGLGFGLRASSLPSRCSTTWATLLVHFALVILEMGVSRNICSNCPQAVILLISASHVARITGMSHWCPAALLFLFLFIWDGTSLCSPGCPGTCCIAQAGLKLTVLLPQPSKC